MSSTRDRDPIDTYLDSVCRQFPFMPEEEEQEYKAKPWEELASDFGFGEQNRINAYLDAVCGEILFLPQEEIDRIRFELRQHIEEMVDAIVDTELKTRNVAIVTALVRFGDARTVGIQIAKSSPRFRYWERDKNGTPRWIGKIEAVNLAILIGLVFISVRLGSHHPYFTNFFLPTACLILGAWSTISQWMKLLYETDRSPLPVGMETEPTCTNIRLTRHWRYAWKIIKRAVCCATRDKTALKRQLYDVRSLVTTLVILLEFDRPPYWLPLLFAGAYFPVLIALTFNTPRTEPTR